MTPPPSTSAAERARYHTWDDRWPGAFANQDTACRLRHEETLEQLAHVFGLPVRSARDAV